MASYQYVYTMQGLNKTWPGGKTVLKDIHLSFPARGEDWRAWSEWRG